MMWRVAVALLTVILLGAFWIERQAQRIDTLTYENRELQRAAETYKRIQNADTSRGDTGDDTDWLCARSPSSAGCSGRAK